MEMVPDSNRRTILLSFDEEEWDTVRWVSKTMGSTFLQTYLAGFLEKRRAQRKSDKKEEIHKAFESASEEDRRKVLEALKLPIDDAQQTRELNG